MKKHFRITALILLSLASSACVTVRYLGSNTNPLAEAIESNNTQEASRLLAAGADVNARNDYGVTLLQYASAYKQKDLVEFLIAKGADINAKDNRGLTPLLWTFTTSQNDRAQIAELLIAKGADINAKTNEGVTPLYGAVHDDRIKVAELLINRGAEIDAKTTNGDTPLILVASYGNRDFAKLLIDHGANVNAKDNKGRSPLDWVLMSYALASPLRQMSQLDATKQQVMQEWIQKQYQISADQLQEIQQEVQKMKGQWLDVVKLLIHHGVDINAALKKEGSSILVVAARLGSKDLVEALMGLGANINDAETGETALQGAIAEKHGDVAEYLISKDADVNGKNISGRTPLHFLAFFIDDPKLAEALLERGADINAKDNNGETPLAAATRAGNNQVAKVLRERGGK